MTRNEKIEAWLNQDDEAFVQAALDTEKGLAQIEALSTLRHSQSKKMAALFIVLIILFIVLIVLLALSVAGGIVFKSPFLLATLGFWLVAVDFVFLLTGASHNKTDLKIKMLKVMQAVRS